MVFIATATITNFINEMIATSAKPTILEFATEVHKRFYPEQDVTFMNYFFELASQENEGKFVVPHQKLIEYGVATSTRSSNLQDRLETLGLEEGPEYLLLDIQQRNKNGRGATTKHIYMLTPEAFKKCLMRAQRRSAQSIDVTQYAKYYLFLCVLLSIKLNSQHRKYKYATKRLLNPLYSTLSTNNGLHCNCYDHELHQ